MTTTDAKRCISTLAHKASHADNSPDALRFSQAAANLANALCALNSADAMSSGAVLPGQASSFNP